MVTFIIFCIVTVVSRRRSSIRRRQPRRPRRTRRTRQICLATEEPRPVQPRKKRTTPPRALTAATFRKWITRFSVNEAGNGETANAWDTMQLSWFKIGQVELRCIQCELREPPVQCINIRKSLASGDAHFLARRHHRVSGWCSNSHRLSANQWEWAWHWQMMNVES